MPLSLLEPNPENGSIHELKTTSRLGTYETSLRCTAIQMLITGISREQVYEALSVTPRSIQKWINAFNRRGVDGLFYF
ncbi:MAG: helix-turn-helix domain-containing protein [Nitrospirae bacterium]|nr:helix-turn-helix domain-containing protein [Nitrospirota bacterium]